MTLHSVISIDTFISYYIHFFSCEDSSFRVSWYYSISSKLERLQKDTEGGPDAPTPAAGTDAQME
jgi:hypothetical protein